MRNIFITLSILLISISGWSQEKLAELTTTKSLENETTVYHVEVLWEVYKDSLVLSYTNPRVIKRLQKKGLPIRTVIPVEFTLEENERGVWYSHQDSERQIRVIVENKIDNNKSVSIKTKDSFTEKIYTEFFH